MYPTLVHIPHTFFGLPLFGFGLLLAIWIGVSLATLAWLVRKQGWSGDALGYLPVFAVVAAAIIWVLPAISDEKGLPIRGYGVMMLLAVLAATGLAVWRARRAGVDPDVILSLAFWMFVPGILGARLFYTIEYWNADYAPVFREGGFAAGALALLNVAKGGLVVYGAFLGGLVGMLLFVRRRRLPLFALADLIAPSLILGQAIGRIGCLLNGCCFGGVCDVPWAVAFPEDSPPYQSQVERGLLLGLQLSSDPLATPVKVLALAPDSPAARAGVRPGDTLQTIEGAQITMARHAQRMLSDLHRDRAAVMMTFSGGQQVTWPATVWPGHSLAVHPTQLYSAIDAFLLCLLLLAYDPFVRRDGELFAMLLTVHPISRFLLESIRTDENSIFGTGLTISQNFSLLFFVLGLGLWIYLRARPPRRVWPPVHAPARNEPRAAPT